MISESLAKEEPTNVDFKRSLSIAHTDLGNALLAAGNISVALEHRQKALGIDQALAAVEPQNTRLQASLGTSYERIASLLGALGDFRGALEHYNAAKLIADRLASSDAANATWKGSVSTILAMIGDTHLALGQFSDARSTYGQALSIMLHLTRVDPENTVRKFDVALVHFRIALSEVFLAESDPHHSADVARALYALKESIREEDLIRFTQLTINLFQQARINREARNQLGRAVNILRQAGTAGRLPDYSLRWGRIVEAAYAAMDQAK
jgi:tetratricopeptide (TPR) repeat protein